MKVNNWVLITHRRSVAKRGGCFQRRLFVSQCVCLFVRTITSERLNVGRWNLAVRCIVQNIARVRLSRSKVKGQGHRGQNKRKTAELLTMHGKAKRAL